MRLHHLLVLGLSISMTGALPALATPANGQAAGQQGAPAATQARPGKTIYGSQLMTPAERNAYRAHMRSLKTAQERQAFRMQHHQEMQQRAKERGMTLPDMPMGPAGMGPGGMGPGGMGPGGMGPGHMGAGGMGPGSMGRGQMGPGGMGPGNMGQNPMGPGAGMQPTQKPQQKKTDNQPQKDDGG